MKSIAFLISMLSVLLINAQEEKIKGYYIIDSLISHAPGYAAYSLELDSITQIIDLYFDSIENEIDLVYDIALYSKDSFAIAGYMKQIELKRDKMDSIADYFNSKNEQFVVQNLLRLENELKVEAESFATLKGFTLIGFWQPAVIEEDWIDLTTEFKDHLKEKYH